MSVIVSTLANWWREHPAEESNQLSNLPLDSTATHTPLLVAAPGYGGSEVSCPHPVELVDVFPTLAALCRLEPAANLNGVSLQSSLRAPEGPAPRTGAISVVQHHVKVVRGKGFCPVWMTLEQDVGLPRRVLGRSVRSKNWRYTEWDGGEPGVELYDVGSDPHGLNNLSSGGLYPDVTVKLRDLLHEPDVTPP